MSAAHGDRRGDGHGEGRGAESAAFGPLIALSRLGVNDCLLRLRSSAAGLDADEAAARLRALGANEIARREVATLLRQLGGALGNPFSLLLLVLVSVSVSTGDRAGAAILAVMLALSLTLRFVQEFRSEKAAERLRRMVRSTAAVCRTGAGAAATGSGAFPAAREFRELPIEQLVPGDLLRLAAGDLVPADVRLLSAKDLFVNQSSLTGEAFPVEKQVAAAADAADVLALPNVCFMGSAVVSGSAIAVVAETGARTYLGRISRALVARRQPTEFDRGVQRLSWLLIRFMLVMVPLVFVINGLAHGDWSEALLFAIAVAVGLTPEMLPMIVTGTLARGAVAMSGQRVIVKRLDAIENFGAMDVLCTDKTGTLTQDRIVLRRHVDVDGEESEEVLQHAFLNSYYQTGLRNLLDVAILEHERPPSLRDVDADYRLIDEIPFDFERRRMSVVVSERGHHHELICKGAVDEVVAACTQAKTGGRLAPLDEATRRAVLDRAQDYNAAGLRTIAVAYKEVPAEPRAYGLADERELVLLGFIAFLDPPKDSARPAIEALRRYGVEVKILTGDSPVIALGVCREVGLALRGRLVGAEVDALDDAGLAAAADGATVFARLSPLQKERIVRALRARGRVVGFLGDGINDAPALRAADIGISVDSAVDIAKESADIILLEKNLGVLGNGVIEGRRTFGNILKYTKMAASANFGNMFSVVGAGLLLPFLPMLPLQLLIQNLLYDISQTAIPFDRVDEDFVLRPRRWSIRHIGRFMLVLGPLSSLFDYATFALMWFGFGARTAAQESLFQTGWFVESLLSQTLIVHVIRTGRLPFVQSRAAAPLIATTLGVAALSLWLPYSPIAPALGLCPLPAVYFAGLLAVIVAYALATEWAKRRFEDAAAGG